MKRLCPFCGDDRLKVLVGEAFPDHVECDRCGRVSAYEDLVLMAEKTDALRVPLTRLEGGHDPLTDR